MCSSFQLARDGRQETPIEVLENSQKNVDRPAAAMCICQPNDLEGSMKAQLLSLVLGAALLAGCYTAPVIPPIGFLYGSVSAPIDVDNNETQMGSNGGEGDDDHGLGPLLLGRFEHDGCGM